MSGLSRTLALAAVAALAGTAANAASDVCEAGKPRSEITTADAQALYDCLADAMFAGYNTGDKRWIPEEFVADYRDWTPVNTAPAAPGFHAERYLSTWVNDAGAEEYLKYLEERGDMPEGTLIAKESFEVSDDGVAKAGPLFIMQKVGEGVSPETNDWYYMMVSARGKPVAVDVYAACNVCHQDLFGQRDGMGYLIEEVRVGN